MDIPTSFDFSKKEPQLLNFSPPPICPVSNSGNPMAKNRNKRKSNGAVSMDTSEPSVSEAPQAMDTSESGPQTTVSSSTIKMKQKGRPMKRSRNVRKMKALAKAISSNEKSVEKIVKNENKKMRVQSAKTLYE